jgi:hypothetical protein
MLRRSPAFGSPEHPGCLVFAGSRAGILRPFQATSGFAGKLPLHSVWMPFPLARFSSVHILMPLFFMSLGEKPDANARYSELHSSSGCGSFQIEGSLCAP